MPEDITRLLERSTPDRFDEPDFDALIRKGRRRRTTQRAMLATVVVAVLAIAIALVPLSTGDPAPVVDEVPAQVGGVWEKIPDGPLSARIDPFTFTTDDGRVIVWGGLIEPDGVVWDGRTIPPDEADSRAQAVTDGAIFDPSTGRWTAIPAAPIDTPEHAWTLATVDAGTLAVLGLPEGRRRAADPEMHVATYDLQAGEWHKLDAAPVEARQPDVFLLDGDQLILWGGQSRSSDVYNDGAVYDLRSSSWTKMSTAPLSPSVATAWTWTGQRLLVWGGKDNMFEDQDEVWFDDGAVYESGDNSWKKMSPSPLAARSDSAAIWTGSAMIVLGGEAMLDQEDDSEPDCPDGQTCEADREVSLSLTPGRPSEFLDGARYDPQADRWEKVSSVPQRSGAAFRLGDTIAAAVWWDHGRAAIYQPSTDSWRPTRVPNATLPVQLLEDEGQLAAVTNPDPRPMDDNHLVFEAWIRDSDGWLQAPPPPFPRLTRAAVAYVDGSLFVWGGGVVHEPPEAGRVPPPRLLDDGWIWHPER